MSELPSSVPDLHCPVNITEGNSLLDSDNQPKFNGGNTWPYYLASSDNQANADVQLGTVKAEIDSRSRQLS
ncbi:hypothetical protein [Shewanella surugensis]|uniref:Uncharacterized protein n=1 Tax=Shewanella surugensis TaxID=212020 RepID=A0ABT0LF23_9GAMM|nr:hypothetical protein [Shewanella surugensis]MCL1126299.1 hypothetical protein [Shewanella surugensis]